MVTLGNFRRMLFFAEILAKKNGKKSWEVTSDGSQNKISLGSFRSLFAFFNQTFKIKIVKMHCKSACVFLTNNSQGRRRK